MPVGGQRDLEETRATLATWLRSQLPHARDLAIENLVVPQATGFSNETILFDAHYRAEGAERRDEYVLRAQPAVWAVFPEIDVISQQYRTMAILGEHSDVPVAKVRWAEPDTSVLGTPFFVMDRLHGQTCGDRPPYTVEGWWMELSTDARRQLHSAGIEAMTKVNRVDWRRLDFGYLDKSDRGSLGREQRLAYFEGFWSWAREGEAHLVADAAWEFTRSNWPTGEPVELCWGDARPGNQMYADGRVLAVMDWEMVSLGNAVSDLGWWLFLQRFHTDGTGVALPAGMLTRDETIALWESKVGRRADHVDFYEIVAGFHFTLVMMRIIGMTRAMNPAAYHPAAMLHNPVSALTAGLLGIKLPKPPH